MSWAETDAVESPPSSVECAKRTFENRTTGDTETQREYLFFIRVSCVSRRCPENLWLDSAQSKPYQGSALGPRCYFLRSDPECWLPPAGCKLTVKPLLMLVMQMPQRSGP